MLPQARPATWKSIRRALYSSSAEARPETVIEFILMGTTGLSATSSPDRIDAQGGRFHNREGRIEAL